MRFVRSSGYALALFARAPDVADSRCRSTLNRAMNPPPAAFSRFSACGFLSSAMLPENVFAHPPLPFGLRPAGGGGQSRMI